MSALPGEADEPPRGPPGAPFVVGIRAGSADAVDRFLATIGADSGMSFVVVGDPGAALGRDRVARHTPMPVVPVEGATELEPDRVYLVADGSAVTITAGVLHPDRTRAATDAPADTFFRALADDQHENAAFVVMGAASPGSPGLAAARRHGGLVLIEAPVAGDPGGPTDEVVRPEQMPLRLVEAARRRGPRPDDAALLAAVAPLCAAIALHTGDDFSHYKATTLVRRIERRLAALRLASVEPYVARVRTDPDEARALVRELMVSVTQFFREPEALALAVREALAAHASVAPPTGPIRIWVPGCATGEEAYSIAMLAREALGDTGGALQLFASDIDAAALDVARAGWYPIAIAERVSPARLARFFARDGDGYRVTKALREDCSFAVHNVLRDPPFARLALVSCRNLFIYLELTLQAELLPLFHYALRPGGVLVLGAAETVSGAPDLFDTIDAMRRVYQRREQAHRLSLRAPLEASQARGRIGLAPRAPASGPVARALERALLDEHAPPGAVITHAGAVVYLCGRTEPYLDPPHGQVPFDLFAMTKPMLRHELRNALAQAIASGAEVATRDLLVPGAGVVRLRVRPMRELGAGADLYLVVFQAQPRAAAATTADPEAPLVETLERELDATRAQWRGTLHELETANEELRASNEELQAVNEELQTSREELQSTNEELTTLNTELAQRVAALDAAHDDLHNLFDATHIAVVLLDRAQRIRRFSPAARDLFRLIATDVGRPLADIAPRFTPVDLEAAVADVLATLAPRELAVHRPDGDARYQLRVLPYRSLSGEVDGVVVTFVDVTLLERAERRARHRAEELERVMDALPAMVFFTDDPHAAVVTGNAASARQLRARDGAPLPLGLASPAGGFRIFHDGVELDREQLAITRAARGESVRDFEIEIRFDDGTVRNMLGNAEPLRDDAGQPRGAVGAFVDITARIRAEQEQRAGEERYRTLAATAIDLIARYDRDHRYLYVNPALAARLGKRLDEIVGRSTAEIGRPSAWSEHLGEVFATGQGMRVDWFGTDGRWYDVQLSPELEGDRVASVVTVARDITEQKVAEDALRGSEQRYAAIFATAPFGLAVTRARDGIILAVNPAFARIFERGAEDIVGQTSIALGISEPAVRDQMMAELASTGVVRGFVSRRRMPSGRERALSISIDLVTVDGERLTISSIEDITERVAAEAAAQAAQRETEVQRAQLEAVIESVQDGIVVLDPAGRVVLVNSAEAQHYDLPGPPHAVDLAMLVGRYELSTPDGEVVPPEQWPAARVLRGESIVDVELRVRWDAQPMPRDVSFSGQPIRDAQGTPALIVIVTRDISERKRREVEHARLQADLAQAQKMEAVGTLAGGVAHDFNNILGGVMGGLSLLEAELGTSARIRADIEEMKALVKRGADLSKQLLGFARRGKYDVKPLDLAQVVASTSAMFGRTRRDVVIAVDTAPDLRPVLMDHVQLEQVLLNLFVNAAQAMPDGGRLSVRASNEAVAPGADAARFVTLVVADTGVGMDEATRARIFEPFFTTKGPGQGTGLGLASVYGIVAHHSGTIEVASTPGVGTAFTLRLPATDGDITVDRPLTGRLHVGQGTVLIVDDEPQMVRVYGRMLEKAGYKVLTALSGAIAIEQVRKHGADIAMVILDMTMPEMSGARTFDGMRALAPDLKVLLSSGFGAEGQAQEILGRGCAGFIQKPFTAAELTAKLRELI